MIRNIADILQAFAAAEARKLSEYEMKHGPTIGAMYEGLSSAVINKSIPVNLGLQVVSGFVIDGEGGLSGQMDCMLVRGHGEEIPYTNAKKWPVWDVLAVFEVKKTLFGDTLGDAFVHLRSVHHMYEQWLLDRRDAAKPLDISRALRAFSRITGVHAPDFDKFNRVLPPDLAFIYYALVMEQLAPVRIVLGYEGYSTERGLREGMVSFLERAQAGSAGYGVGSFPHLVNCRGFSLCKTTGQPYMAPIDNGYWHFLCSSPTNPIWLMLELLWTKIENTCGISLPWDDDVVQEVFHPLVSAQGAAGKGWHYKWADIGKLDESPTTSRWQPCEITTLQYAILNRVVTEGEVDTREPELREYLEKNGIAIEAAIADLRNTGFIAMDGTVIRPTVSKLHFVWTPDGKMFAGEHPGQMASFVTTITSGKSS